MYVLQGNILDDTVLIETLAQSKKTSEEIKQKMVMLNSVHCLLVMHVRMHVCMYVCMYVCVYMDIQYVCIIVMYVCIVVMYVCIDTQYERI